MYKRFLLLFLLLFYGFQASATHIVGGEFELRYISGNTYRLTLNLYFDLVTGDPDARDLDIQVGIYENSSRNLIGTVVLPFRSETEVKYTDIECAKPGVLRTSKLVYYRDILLNPTTFNNPQGYFAVWQRCCRNGTIHNIIGPGETGQAFYMEFPPVTRNGQAFRNSSPVLFPPLSDYACLNELFYYDFSGTDPDGDSLVYDLVTPLRGTSSSALGNRAPVPAVVAPASYPLVSWVTSPIPGNSYSRENQVLGSPALTIHPTTGRLTVRPIASGLFVFGIRCQEFRNGVKIGEVRRDFQLMVLADCRPNNKPGVSAIAKGKSGFFQPGEVIRISPADERCFEIKFTDPDPATRISLKALPVNFSNSNYTLGGITAGTINTGAQNDTLTATVCFASCFDTEGKIYEMDLIATDDGCSLPKIDTLRMRFVIEPIPDTPPTLTLSAGTLFSPMTAGDLVSFDVTGNDAEGDIISLTARGVNFNLGSQKITFQNRTGTGPLTSTFSWPLDCQALLNEVYKIEFTVKTEQCGVIKTTTEVVEVHTIYPNTPPVLTSDKQETAGQQLMVFDLELNEAFEARLFGDDGAELHPLLLQAAGQGFNLSALGMTFEATGGAGQAEGVFKWVASCDAAEQGVVRVDFLLKETACRPSPDQKLTMEFRVRVPDITTFLPANIFTPNGDGLNDYFEMPTLPQTTCKGNFEKITVFNRWGKEVYSSTDLKFRWDGKNVVAGVYYYIIDYSSSVFKGSVTLVH